MYGTETKVLTVFDIKLECFFVLFPAVELLSEVVQNCSLNEADLEQQRGVVLRELEEVESSLQDVCLDLLHATAFQGTPLGQSVLGPSSNARHEELHAHTHTFKYPEPQNSFHQSRTAV